MTRVAFKGALALLLAIGSASELSAQLGNAAAVGDDWGSLGVNLGLFAPMTTFEDDQFGESSFENGGAIAVTGTAWPLYGRRLGVKVGIVRSETEGYNETSEFAPLPANDPTQWLLTAEAVGRIPMASGFPYVSLGAGMKQYNWANAVHDEDRFLAITGSLGYEFRPRQIGPVGFNAELRGYYSKFRGFGIDDGTWEVGTPAIEGQDIGFYGGKVGGVNNFDVLFSTGLSLYF